MLRLNSFLASKGGVRDPGGDVYQTIGGYKGRPGLISSAGMTLDDAALAAWEAGYLHRQSKAERPSINDLLEAIDQDHNGRIPVYSERDEAPVSEARPVDPALALIEELVAAWRSGNGKRSRLRPLMRKAEMLVESCYGN